MQIYSKFIQSAPNKYCLNSARVTVAWKSDQLMFLSGEIIFFGGVRFTLPTEFGLLDIKVIVIVLSVRLLHILHVQNHLTNQPPACICLL